MAGPRPGRGYRHEIRIAYFPCFQGHAGLRQTEVLTAGFVGRNDAGDDSVKQVKYVRY
jgi:hypothetical protein